MVWSVGFAIGGWGLEVGDWMLGVGGVGLSFEVCLRFGLRSLGFDEWIRGFDVRVLCCLGRILSFNVYSAVFRIQDFGLRV